MQKGLISLLGASAIAAGCASSPYDTNLDHNYFLKIYSSEEASKNLPDKTLDFGFDRYSFVEEINPLRMDVMLRSGGSLRPDQYFPFPAVKESERETSIDPILKKVTHTEGEGTYTVFIYSGETDRIRTTIPVDRVKKKPGLLTKLDIGQFKIPLQVFKRKINGKEVEETVAYCSTTISDPEKRQIPVIVRYPELVPNYEAGVLELRGRFYLGHQKIDIMEIPKLYDPVKPAPAVE